MTYDPALDYLDEHQMAVIRIASDLRDRHMRATGNRPEVLHLSDEAWNTARRPSEVIGMRVAPMRTLRGFSGAVFGR